MGRYYNPPDKIREIGRELENIPDFERLENQLKEKEELWALTEKDELTLI